MAVPVQQASAVAEIRPVADSARTLLRFVDRAALDELTDAFASAVGLPATVLAPGGEFVAGARVRCPACDGDAASKQGADAPASIPSFGWAQCAHGLRRRTFPISARTGELLAVVAVGPLATADRDLGLLRRALVAQGESERRARERAGGIQRSTPSRVDAATRLLAQTFETVVREAAIASENADLVATQRQANRELTVLYSVARALGSGIELRAILQQLVEAVVAMLGSDVALVGLIEGDDLVTAASSGLLTFEARNGRLKVGEGLAGRVAASGEPLTCRDMQEDPRQYLTAFNSREQLHAFAGVPLILQGETVGVLAVYRRVPHAIPESELRLLVHIADQAAVAMERTRLYEQERRTIGELRALHGQVERQHRALERATVVHEQLTQMVLQNAGLDAIVETLALSLESRIEVEDRFHQILARGPRQGEQSLTGPAEAHAPGPQPTALAQEEQDRLFETVRDQRRPVTFPAAPALGHPHPRTVAPVVVGGDLLGYLSVAGRDRPLEESDRLALGHAATVIALEMMKQRTRAEVERRLRGELLEELLGGGLQDPEAVQRRAAYLGYNLTTPHALLFVTEGPAGASLPGTTAAENGWSLAEACEGIAASMRTGSMSLARSDGVVVALPLLEGSTEEAQRVAEALRNSAGGLIGGKLLTALGRICRSPEDFAVSVPEARRAVALARSLGATDRVIVFEDLGVYRLLLDLPHPTDAVRFADELLGPLRAYDRRHGASLVATLEAYLAENGVQARAAAALSVHVNTLAYRLHQIRELTGADLQDGDARLGLHLAVKIRQVVSAILGDEPQ